MGREVTSLKFRVLLFDTSCVGKNIDHTLLPRWVLNTMDNLGLSLEEMPTLYLVPLGTGNDLARTLGFGPGADGSLNVRDVMRQIADEETTNETLLDRWKVNVKPMRYYGMVIYFHYAHLIINMTLNISITCFNYCLIFRY